MAQVDFIGHAIEEIISGILGRAALRVEAVGHIAVLQLIEVARRPFHVLLQLFAAELVHGDLAAGILIIEGDIFGRNGTDV
ncbi:hypothetical protein D3C71_1549950 [compost metagenome]